jgi:hypothetical protein
MARDHGPQIKNDEAYEKLIQEGNSREKAARIANYGRKKAGHKGGKARKYEDRPKSDLYEEARKIGIAGRSRMNKSQLIEALRNH